MEMTYQSNHHHLVERKRPMEVLMWIATATGFLGQYLMARSRHIAIRIVLATTVFAVAWAVHIQDWPNVIGNIIKCVFLVLTIRAWDSGK